MFINGSDRPILHKLDGAGKDYYCTTFAKINPK